MLFYSLYFDRKGYTMAGLSFQFTGVILSQLERLMGTQIHISGGENIPKGPKLFLVNHFTRFETFVLPYVFYKKFRLKTRSLAHHGLFQGTFGAYLERMGTLSTKTPQRNRIIISDLFSGAADWIIYPEGLMVKNKSLVKNGKLFLDTPAYQGPPRTGAALMALKAELLRQAPNSGDLRERYNSSSTERSEAPIQIVPVSLSYYPLRPDGNLISALAKKYIKDLPGFIEEELMIEGNFMLGGQMNIHIGQPLSLEPIVRQFQKSWTAKVPLIQDKREAVFLNKYRKKLTQDSLRHIYRNTILNIDHIGVLSLSTMGEKVKSIEAWLNDFQAIVAYALKNNFRLTHDLNYYLDLSAKDLLTVNPSHKTLAAKVYDFIKLAIREGYVLVDNKQIIRLKKKRQIDKDFYRFRLNNTIQVIQNEVSFHTELINFAKRLKFKNEKTKQRLYSSLYQSCDRLLCQREREKYQASLKIDEPFAFPKYLKGPNKHALVLCHGFTASPGEVEDLAKKINAEGYPVYLVRMSGHGSSPEAMKQTHYEDWYHSFLYGIKVLQAENKSIVVAGLSTGALIALKSMVFLGAQCKAFIALNGAFDLQDSKSQLAVGVSKAIHFIENIHLNSSSFNYVNRNPSHPEHNYQKNYIDSIAELRKLIGYCSSQYEKIQCPALIVQSDSDPTVRPEAAKSAFKKFNSNNKNYLEIDSKEHVITHSPQIEKYWDQLIYFLDALN